MALTYEQHGSTRIVVAEYMAHPDDPVADRIKYFWSAARFLISTHEMGKSIRVTPDVPGENIPAISYWRTSNPEKIGRFVSYEPDGEAEPSGYSRGWRYPWLQDSVEVALELPTNADVLTVYRNMDGTTRRHVYAGPHEHPEGSDRLDLRIEDMLNMSVRITGPNIE